jgi:hypothetical protein
MNYHALGHGLISFPMMGWPYYVRNPNRNLTFNDFLVPKLATPVSTNSVAKISFFGLNYPTMNEL